MLSKMIKANNDFNPVKLYLEQIAKYSPLTLEEESELGRKIRENNDEEARKKLITSNLRLVVFFAKQYMKKKDFFIRFNTRG